MADEGTSLYYAYYSDNHAKIPVWVKLAVFVIILLGIMIL